MKINVRLLCRTALLLALCIASQFLKNTSVYITGTIVNAILIIATVTCGLIGGGSISVIAPLTSWLITGSPIISAYPAIVPCIMIGNLILVVGVWFFDAWLKKRIPKTWMLIAGTVLGSVIKSVFMWLMIVKIILPAAAPEAVKLTFSVTQLTTALIGGAVALLILPILKKALHK